MSAPIVPLNDWGTAHSAIGNPYLFTGRRFDEETGLYYYRARYFDDEQARFISRDPLGYVDGMNLYEYVIGNPVIFLDPTGRLICKCSSTNPPKKPPFAKVEFVMRRGRIVLLTYNPAKKCLNNRDVGNREMTTAQGTCLPYNIQTKKWGTKTKKCCGQVCVVTSTWKCRNVGPNNYDWQLTGKRDSCPSQV